MRALISAWRKWRLIAECKRVERMLATQRAEAEIHLLAILQRGHA